MIKWPAEFSTPSVCDDRNADTIALDQGRIFLDINSSEPNLGLVKYVFGMLAQMTAGRSVQ